MKLRESLSSIVSAWRLHGPRTGTLAAAAKLPGLRAFTRAVTGGRLVVAARVLEQTAFVDAFDPGISWQLLRNGTREEAHVAQIRGALKPGMRGIEMGANIGFFTLVEAPIIGSAGFIWCIEPVPSNVALLRRTIAANDLESRTAVFPLLVGDHDGTQTMYLASASNSHSVSARHAHGTQAELPIVRLDTFMQQQLIDPASVDFIRMDIEGYEVVAVQGMERLLRESPRLKFFIELHPQEYPQWGWTLERFLRHLEGFGLRVRQAAKEREYGEDGNPTTRILNDPTIAELCTAVEGWNPGGVQAYLEKNNS